VNVLRHHPLSFLEKAQAFLEESEAENNLLLAQAFGMGSGGVTLSSAPVLATVHDDHGRVVAAALRTPPKNLILTRAPDEALSSLAEALRRDRVGLPGVVGPDDAAERFARFWAGTRCKRSLELVMYVCDAVAELPEGPGALRLATPADAPLLQEWTAAFQRDTHEPWDEQPVRAFVAHQLADQTLFVWEHDGPAAMVALQGATARGIRVTHVYAPPERRGQGHARRAVAAVTRRMIDAGRAFCVLYADKNNETSNALYQRVGYRPLSEASEWRFT
jgi:hypothetical protein